VTVPVYVVAYASGASGRRDAVVPESVTLAATAPDPPVSVIVVVFTEDGRTSSEKVARIVASTSTLEAPSTGVVEVTVGAVASGAGEVVNVQMKSLARWLPARSWTPVVTTAVYVVP
jgi:hypothetical protein